MKKPFLLASLICAGFVAAQLPSYAEPWFDRCDYNHDGKWNYNEYCKAQRQWIKEHRERPMSEHDLRRVWRDYDKDHDGYVNVEDVRGLHPW
jgi:Ca2+-binding EF-hand superfamily protein